LRLCVLGHTVVAFNFKASCGSDSDGDGDDHCLCCAPLEVKQGLSPSVSYHWCLTINVLPSVSYHRCLGDLDPFNVVTLALSLEPETLF
jgi:hypothetical protein